MLVYRREESRAECTRHAVYHGEPRYVQVHVRAQVGLPRYVQKMVVNLTNCNGSNKYEELQEKDPSREDDVDLHERCPRSRHASGKFWSDVFSPAKLYEFVDAYVNQSQQKVRVHYLSADCCMQLSAEFGTALVLRCLLPNSALRLFCAACCQIQHGACSLLPDAGFGTALVLSDH